MSGKTRILVVEDSKFFSNMVRKAITERIGLEVVVAASLAETKSAVAASDTPFNLALVDVILPDAPDGEAVTWLLEQRIPTVVFTGVFSEATREQLLAKNVIDYVIKDTPSSLDYLINLVDRLSRNRETTVMVVDDSKAARHYVRDLLQTYQFKVIEAADGREALAALAANPDVRLMITDHQMPDINGVDLVKKVRVSHDQNKLAIIGISSSGGGPLSAKFIKYGANDFINKPFLREEFFCRVMQNIGMLEMMRRLTDMATKDALTGIHNRRFFLDAGDALFASAQRDKISLTAAMIDVDFFKKVNDTCGHDGGDAVLKRVAAVLRGQCRQTDIVARFGGEEFAILSVELNDANVRPFFDKVRTALQNEKIEHAGKTISVTASFGICNGVGTSLETMLKVADEMLYKAKENGRNRVEIA